MHFNSVLISCFLFAFAALAFETSKVYSGAVWQNQTEGTFKSVFGVFTVPEASSPEAPESFVTVEIIFDDDSCSTAKFRLGVNVQTQADGYSYRQALYQWYPDAIQKLNISISAGDTIQLNFTQHPESSTSGEVFVKNINNDQSFNKTVSSTHPLCGQTAGWVIQDENNDNGGETALANFGAVSFTQANAGVEGDGFWGPFGATLVQFDGEAYVDDVSGHNMTNVIAYDDGSVATVFMPYFPSNG